MKIIIHHLLSDEVRPNRRELGHPPLGDLTLSEAGQETSLIGGSGHTITSEEIRFVGRPCDSPSRPPRCNSGSETFSWVTAAAASHLGIEVLDHPHLRPVVRAASTPFHDGDLVTDLHDPVDRHQVFGHDAVVR